jgi:hypothetical protein
MNPYNKPATMQTAKTRKKRIEDIFNSIDYKKLTIEQSALKEMTTLLKFFRKADNGDPEILGPWEIASNHFFVICFESYEQREYFRTFFQLQNHGDQYWTASAFLGTIELLKTNQLITRTFAKRTAPPQRKNPFALKRQETDKEKKVKENKEKYSNLKAEVKKTAEKLKNYTEDRTWISISSKDPEKITACFECLKIAPSKYVHIDDISKSLINIGINIGTPESAFLLRGDFKPDKKLTQFIL